MAIKDSKGLVLELINTDNNTPYLDGWLNFGPVVVLPDGHESLREVSVYLTPTELSHRKGEQTIFYNRLDLTQLFNEEEVVLQYGRVTSTQDVLDILNTTYDTSFTEEDVMIGEFAIEVPVPLPDTLTFFALAGSYAFKGSLSVTMELDLIDLADEIVITRMNGLLYPVKPW